MADPPLHSDVGEQRAPKSLFEEGQARLDAIVRSAMDGIVTVDAAQRIVLFNVAAEKMFNMTAADVLGAPLERLIPERHRVAHRAHIDRFINTGETSRRMGLQAPLSALRADGTEFRIEASISKAVVGDQLLLTVILRDITERLRAEESLRRALDSVREGQARLDAIVGSAMDAIVTVDEQQRVVLFNAAAQKMFRCSAAESQGAPLDRFIPARFRLHHREHVAHFGRTGDTSRRMGVQTALSALRADGTEFPIEASISQATVHSRRFFTVILRDITDRTNAERQIHDAHLELRRLSQEMVEVKEEERTRIARELHDELGQALTALKMDVDLLDAMLAPDRSDIFERTAAMRELLDFTVTTTRRISADLRPLVLDDLGLGAAAEWLVQNVVHRAGLACDMQLDPMCVALGEPYASALFRVLQESLTNVVRHAHAKRVEVRMTWSPGAAAEAPNGGGAAVLTVRDDGSGIDRSVPPKRRSYGLRGINERVLLLGGEVKIESQPGAGTLLWARVPIDPGARRSTAPLRSEGSGEE